MQVKNNLETLIAFILLAIIITIPLTIINPLRNKNKKR